MKFGQYTDLKSQLSVAPLVGAWVEITLFPNPSSVAPVAPLVGAWVEITKDKNETSKSIVAPLVGAWVEIPILTSGAFGFTSLPSWERGLKSMKKQKKSWI